LPGRYVAIEVVDDGCGMSESVKAQIFDPFFTTKFTGRGLGLAAVMGIIRTHRGTISIESAPGKGSAFTVVLPAVAPPAEAVSPESRRDLRGYGNILVVDDEELVRGMARFTLERCGYTIEMAADGRAAVEAFAARPRDFAAVLLDLTMPIMDGEQALERIRQIRPDVPVLLSSGFSEVEALRRFQDRGLAGFLQKPYTATALARKVKHAVKLNGQSPV
jgi:CheY-like chemotaxis protein